MGLALEKEEKRFSYGDYLGWGEEERWELIDGMAYDMSPSPLRRHQEFVLEIATQFHNYLLDKPCKVYVAPFDVRLPEANEPDDEIETVVQPDIVVICDENKLDEKGARGAPDIIIEVLSAYTAKKDLITKRYLYEHHKVKQYWVCDPETKEVVIFKLKGDKYERPEEYKKQDKILVDMFPQLEIDLERIFKKIS